MTTLARDGGTPVRDTPLPSVSNASGRTLGAEEIRAVEAVIDSGRLNRTIAPDSRVTALERGFGAWLGVPEVVASTSGTSALHLAVAALDPNPGDEIIVTPITDFGSVIPILAQNAVPVFADVDPVTWCVDPESIRANITDRTRAIMVVHLFGQPADLDPILAIAAEHDIPVIEDCSQAYGATIKGRKVGTFGTMGTLQPPAIEAHYRWRWRDDRDQRSGPREADAPVLGQGLAARGRVAHTPLLRAQLPDDRAARRGRAGPASRSSTA